MGADRETAEGRRCRVTSFASYVARYLMES